MKMEYARLLWEQYGFGLETLGARLGVSDAPRVLANSIPKSGTNLLLRALYLLPMLRRKIQGTIQGDNITLTVNSLERMKPSDVAAAHIKYHPDVDACIRRHTIKHVLMVRDPRDVAVSNFQYISSKQSRHRLHEYFLDKLKSDDERLMASLVGVSSEALEGQAESLSLAEHLRGYVEWIDRTDVLVVRFEDLVGSRGGGSTESQHAVMIRLMEFLGVNLDSSRMEQLATELFSTTSRTFNKGQMGVWQEHFKPEHQAFFEREIAPLARRLGYAE